MRKKVYRKRDNRRYGKYSGRGKWISLIAVFLLVLAVGIFGWFGHDSRAAAQEMDFETVLKLDIYNGIDREMGVYLEDGNPELAADWAIGRIKAAAEQYGISVKEQYLPAIRDNLINRFAKLRDGKLVETNGMGDCTEAVRSYVANVTSESLFTVCKGLAAEVVRTEYFTSDMVRSQEFQRLAGVIKEYEKYISEMSVDKDPAELESDIAGVRQEIAAIQMILADMKVTEAGVSREEWEAQTAAQLNSIAALEERLSEHRKDADIRQNDFEKKFAGELERAENELAELLRQAESAVTELRTEVQERFAESDTKIMELEEQFGVRLTELDTTVNGQVAANYETLLQMIIENDNALSVNSGMIESNHRMILTNGVGIAANRGDIEQLKQADMGIHNNLSLLKNQISSANSDLRLTILELSTRLNDYMAQTDTEIAGIKLRLDNLENRFTSSSGTITQLLGTLLTKADALNTEGLRAQIADNTGMIGGRLAELNGLLQRMQVSLGQTPEELALQESVGDILKQLAEVQLTLDDYNRMLTVRIDALDISLIAARTSLADMSAEVQQQFVGAATELVGIQNAEAVYFARIQERIVTLTNAVSNMLVQANQIADRIYVDQGIASGSAIILDVMEQQRQETEGKISGLENQFTGLLGDLEGKFEETAGTVTELLNMLLTRAGELDAAGIRGKIEENIEMLGRRLTELDEELAELNDSLGDNETEQAVSERVGEAQAETTEVRGLLSEYASEILTALAGVDEELLDARTSLAGMSPAAQQMFADAFERLLNVQNREQQYEKALQERIGLLADRIQSVQAAAAEAADLIYIDSSIRNSMEEIRTMMAEQGNRLESEMSAMDGRFTGFLDILRQSMENADQNMDGRLDELEKRLVVTRLDGFTIAVSDWKRDGGNGRYYYEIQSTAFTENSHVDIQYAGNPGIEPAYSGTTGLMRISVKYPAEVTINNIFIYNDASVLGGALPDAS